MTDDRKKRNNNQTGAPGRQLKPHQSITVVGKIRTHDENGNMVPAMIELLDILAKDLAQRLIAEAATSQAPGQKPERLLRIRDVLEMTGYSQSKWYAEVAKGSAPLPLKRGTTSLWPESEICRFIEHQKATLPRR